MYISCFLCRFHLRRAPNANPFFGGIWALDFCFTISEKSSFDLRLAWVGAKCYHLRCYKQITPITQIIVFQRDWSLITGRGATKQEEGGGASKVLPFSKGGNSLRHAEGGGGQKKFWGSFSVEAYSFSHTERRGGGGRKQFPPFKRGGATFFPCLDVGGGGARKASDPRFSHFVAPPPVPNYPCDITSKLAYKADRKLFPAPSEMSIPWGPCRRVRHLLRPSACSSRHLS